MASITKRNDGKDVAKEAKVDDDREDREDLPLGDDDSDKAPDVPGAGKQGAAEYRAREAALKRRTGGFFTVYKKGQGYWTRMGTVAAAVGLGLAVAYELYDKVPLLLSTADPRLVHRICLGIAVVFLAVYSFFVWRYINKPSTVDFLIATDSEMKKVNWTSRKELIGSTKIVVLFMFMIALSLFLLDVVFGEFFHLIGVLRSGPFASS